jgi:hypothetical protein
MNPINAILHASITEVGILQREHHKACMLSPSSKHKLPWVNVQVCSISVMMLEYRDMLHPKQAIYTPYLL